jgi:uncharacterized protein YciI
MRRRQIHALAGGAALALLGGCASAPTPPAATGAATGATTGAANDGRRDWFIFLETGRATPKGTPEAAAAVAAMQRGHIDNFKRLHGEKKLFAAGPLRDPAGTQRGIVWVRAASRDELLGYFQPDEYVREGYMTVNATPAMVRRALVSEGIDPNGIEEVRIVKIARPAAAADAATAAALQAELKRLLDDGTIGAWFTLDSGPVAELLFARSTDSAALLEALAPYARLAGSGAAVQVWSQWLGKGVVPGPRR